MRKQSIEQTSNFQCSMSSRVIHILSFITFLMFCKWRETVTLLTPSVWDIFELDFAWQLLEIVRCQDCLFCTIKSNVDSSLHVLFIFLQVSKALCLSYNTYNIRRWKPRFDIFIIEGFLWFKCIVILKVNYEFSLSIYAKNYSKLITVLVLNLLSILKKL